LVIEEITLHHILYGRPEDGNGSEENLSVLAASGDLTAEDALRWRQYVSLTPLPSSSEQASRAVGVFDGPDDDFILAQAYYQDGDRQRPFHQYVLLPRPALQAMAGNIKALLELTTQPPAQSIDALEPLEISPAPTWTSDQRQVVFDRLLADYVDMSALFALLGAALNHRGLLIRGFKRDLQARLDLIQGLLMLLPVSARPELTFASHVDDFNTSRPRIVFSEQPGETERYTVELDESGDLLAASMYLLHQDGIHSPYMECLEIMWQGDLKAFVGELRAMEAIAARLMAGQKLSAGLTRLAERHLLDRLALTEGEIPADKLKDVLKDDAPPPGPLRHRYAERLLSYSLQERDSEAASIVARYMDEDPELATTLNAKLHEALETEPDAVYFFVRTRLSEGIDKRWIPLLQAAAVVALQVAIMDGDDETVINWLQLIAREPVSYQLDQVFRDGILTAQPRAHEAGNLGVRLIAFTAKRAPDLVNELLQDDQLIQELAFPLGPALREYQAEAVSESLKLSREVSLIVMSRAIQDAATNPDAVVVFEEDHLAHLWSLYTAGQFDYLPADYRPETIIDRLIEEGAAWLPANALELLLAYIIETENVPLLQQLCTQLARQEKLKPALLAAIQASALPAQNLIDLIRQLTQLEIITPQHAADLYAALLAAYDSLDASWPLVEQMARILQQNPDVAVPLEVLWTMLPVASETRSEMISRVVIRRILSLTEAVDDEETVVERLGRLHEQQQWNPAGRALITNWWREFMQAQPLARLQHLDRLLAGKRSLEEARAVVQTSVAIRKILGRRSLEEFADAIATTYTILQALSDSFDPINRQPLSFDQATVHTEMTARESELSSEERSVLARNLKELAQLIATMAELRSKSTLMRREDNVERQLLSGGQQPQSAVDTMRWLSGYFDGLQNKSGNGE
jgi:hypothetical protein